MKTEYKGKKKNILRAGVTIGLVAAFIIIMAPWAESKDVPHQEKPEQEEKDYKEIDPETGGEVYGWYYGLSVAVGFPMKEPRKMPFETDISRNYIKIQNGVGQIDFQNKEQGYKLAFRQGKGNTEVLNVSDYQFTKEYTVKVNSTPVRMKREGKHCLVALWKDAEYSYAMKMEPAISTKEMKEVVASVTDWEPTHDGVGLMLEESTEDVDLDVTIRKLFVRKKEKEKYGKAAFCSETDGTMVISNAKNILKWKQATFLGGTHEEEWMQRSDVLGLEDSELETEGFEHYVYDDGSRFGLEIRRNAKGYEDCVIVNWTTGADFELTLPNSCGAILDNSDGRWTDEKIAKLVLPE